MTDKGTLIGMMSALGGNLIFNLDYIPADKFSWKPEPKAKSAQEIVNHLLGNINMFNKQFNAVAESNVTDIAAAKVALQTAMEGYAKNLSGASPEKLAVKVQIAGMELPLSALAMIAVGDTINHHGQITYIESLLGDDESHFTPGFFQHFV